MKSPTFDHSCVVYSIFKLNNRYYHYSLYFEQNQHYTVLFVIKQKMCWTFCSTCGMLLSLERQVTTMTTLENLYYGNIAPHEYEVVRGSEYDITAKLVIRHEQELSATLTEQQNVILQKIKDNHTELMNLGERDAFCRGFSLAVRLMVEAMTSEKT